MTQRERERGRQTYWRTRQIKDESQRGWENRDTAVQRERIKGKRAGVTDRELDCPGSPHVGRRGKKAFDQTWRPWVRHVCYTVTYNDWSSGTN